MPRLLRLASFLLLIAAANPRFEDAEKITLPAAALKPGKAALILEISFPKGWHLNAAAPLQYSLDGGKTVKVKPPKLPLKMARSELPCAAIRTFFPSFKSGRTCALK